MAFSNKPIEKMLTEISKSGEFSDAKIDTMRFVMRSMASELERIVIMLIIFWFFSYQGHFLIAALAMVTVRPTAGGFHSKTALGCLLWTMSCFVLALFIFPKCISLNSVTVIIVAIFCIIANIMIAPLLSKQHEKRMDVTKNTRKKITLAFIHLFWFGVVFLNQDHGFAPSIMWILFLQTCQLIAEYIRRKIENKKGKVE